MGQVTQQLQISQGEWVCAGCGQPISTRTQDTEHHDPRGIGPQGVTVQVEQAVIAHDGGCPEVTSMIEQASS